MNEPVTSETYAAQLRRLADLTARVREQRAEAHTWHERQCVAAERAVAERGRAAPERRGGAGRRP